MHKKAKEEAKKQDGKPCAHQCYTVHSCHRDGTDTRFCILCRREYKGPCEPDNYFHP